MALWTGTDTTWRGTQGNPGGTFHALSFALGSSYMRILKTHLAVCSSMISVCILYFNKIFTSRKF